MPSNKVYGVNDPSVAKHKPVPARVKKAKYGFHGKKDLSKSASLEHAV